MEAHLKFKLQIQDSDNRYEHEYPYINVLPKEPTQIYRQKPYNQLEAIKKTQRIPFPEIRELILMYILDNEKLIDVTESEFLKQKLHDNKLNESNHKVNQILDKLIKEKERLVQLQYVSEIYLKQRENLLGAESKRSMLTQFDGSHLSKEISTLQKQKQAVLTKLSQGVNKNNLQAQKKQAENNYNHSIVDLFERQTPELEKISQKFLQKFQDIKKFHIYIEQFEKAFVFVLGAKHIENKQYPSGQEQLLKEVLGSSIKESLLKIESLIDSITNDLYEWRISCKYDKSLKLDVQDVQRRNIKMHEEIRQKVYGFIPDILLALGKDKGSIKKKENEMKIQYGKFIPGYFDALEVNLFFKKQSTLNQIIQNEKELLGDHLRKNYGMMVHYSKSQAYISSIQLNNNATTSSKTNSFSSNKGYLKEIVSNKIVFIEDAINFINKQYPEMYKEACNGNSGVGGKIRYDGREQYFYTFDGRMFKITGNSQSKMTKRSQKE